MQGAARSLGFLPWQAPQRLRSARKGACTIPKKPSTGHKNSLCKIGRFMANIRYFVALQQIFRDTMALIRSMGGQ
jgi:hypothetical protein